MNAHTKQQDKVFQTDLIDSQKSNPPFAHLLALSIYEPVTKGRDLKWDTLPQNQTPSKLFSVLPLESSMFQVTISIIKKWF